MTTFTNYYCQSKMKSPYQSINKLTIEPITRIILIEYLPKENLAQCCPWSLRTRCKSSFGYFWWRLSFLFSWNLLRIKTSYKNTVLRYVTKIFVFILIALIHFNRVYLFLQNVWIIYFKCKKKTLTDSLKTRYKFLIVSVECGQIRMMHRF